MREVLLSFNFQGPAGKFTPKKHQLEENIACRISSMIYLIATILLSPHTLQKFAKLMTIGSFIALDTIAVPNYEIEQLSEERTGLQHDQMFLLSF